MTESPHETKTTEPTPEQLMQLLDLQIASQRSKRKGGRKHRGVLLIGGLVLLLGVMFGALLVLQQMIGDLRPESGAARVESTVVDSQ